MQVSVPCGDVNLLVVIYVSEYKLVHPGEYKYVCDILVQMVRLGA